MIPLTLPSSGLYRIRNFSSFSDIPANRFVISGSLFGQIEKTHQHRELVIDIMAGDTWQQVKFFICLPERFFGSFAIATVRNVPFKSYEFSLVVEEPPPLFPDPPDPPGPVGYPVFQLERLESGNFMLDHVIHPWPVFSNDKRSKEDGAILDQIFWRITD